MKVLFATAEFAPLVRVGGLAAAAAGLVAELRRQGVDVEVALPDYFETPLQDETVTPLTVPEWAGPAAARTGTLAGVGRITLVTSKGIVRPNPYLQPDGVGWDDNDERFLAFSAAVAALVGVVKPDVVHLNDWHTATVPAHLRERPPVVLTVHTLGYQGTTNAGWLKVLPFQHEAFAHNGDTNPLAGGITLADLVIAVSPNYAAEIITPAGGFGLDHLLRAKGERLVGIRNGIDTTEWDPQHDRQLPSPFGAGDVAGKAAARAAVLETFGLPDSAGPLLAMVTRLTHQKGLDLALPLVEFLPSLHARMVVLGDGDEHLVDAIEWSAGARPQHFAFRRGYHEGLAHRLFAAADIFVMPSRFEPCGLAQMQAMRYGALPLVTDVGGLHDTVVDIDADPVLGTGAISTSVSPIAVLDGAHRLVRAWSQPRRRAAMQRRGMTADWSWQQPAAAHAEWYDHLVGKRV